MELLGVAILGRAEVVGEVPRRGEENAALREVERLFARKYAGSDDVQHDGRHAWPRVDPAKISSWDFRKMAAA